MWRILKIIVIWGTTWGTSTRINLDTTYWLLYILTVNLCAVALEIFVSDWLLLALFVISRNTIMWVVFSGPPPVTHSMIQSKLSTQNMVGTPPLSWGIRRSTLDSLYTSQVFSAYMVSISHVSSYDIVLLGLFLRNQWRTIERAKCFAVINLLLAMPWIKFGAYESMKQVVFSGVTCLCHFNRPVRK